MSSEYTDGLEAIFTYMDRHNSEQEVLVDAEVQAAGIECQALTKQAAPVGTPESTHKKGYIGGRLRASYQYQRLGPRECKVWTNLSYAAAVELGHVTRNPAIFVKAQPHFFPSYETAKRHMIEALKDLGV